AHEKARDGMLKLGRSLAAHFPVPCAFEDWFWATSLIQARAVRFGVEYWRSLSPRCRGTIVWQLNDCWPVISWSTVDGDGRRKPVWYALREAYADRLLTVQPAPGQVPGGDGSGGDGLLAAAVNDGAAPWELSLRVARQDFYGRTLAHEQLEMSARPGQSVAVAIGPGVATPGDPAREMLSVTGGGHRALWFYAEDKDLELPAPALEVDVERAEGGYDVTLAASTLQRDVAILAGRADPGAESEEMLFTLLPGESRRVHIRSERAVDLAAFARPDVLRSANQLCRPRAGEAAIASGPPATA
ncbi:MAG: glycoside hydrolase family 2 protein, partial [Acidimicrobiales bacterium]